MGLLDRGASEPGWYTSVVVCLRTGLHKHRVVPHQRDREDFGWFSANEIVNILGNLLVNGFAETLGGSVVPHTRDCKDNQYNCRSENILGTSSRMILRKSWGAPHTGDWKYIGSSSQMGLQKILGSYLTHGIA